MINAKSFFIALGITFFFNSIQGQWNSNGTDIYNTNSGFVGIGVAAPASKLHIFQNNDTDPMPTITVQGTASSGSLPGIDNYIGKIVYTTRNNNVVGSIRGYYNGASGSPNYYPYGNLIFYTSKGDNKENEAMRINSNGFVGIGETNPQSKLTVFGGSSIPIGDVLHLGSGISWGGSGAALTLGGGNLKSARILGYTYDGNSHAGSLYLQVKKNDGSWYSGLTIQYINGYVGIGTDFPKNLLDVKGTIHAQEVKVDMNNWSDFVFHPSYQLKPLMEVEKFIKANGHLQDIPSAKEVEQNGVNVGEMQAKLLQKVEELTLYVIEKDKEIAKLKAEKDNQLAEQQKLLMELKNEIEILKTK